jgi:hypothetical protein
VTHILYDTEEVPNAKHMHVVDEEVSLSQPKTATVPPEEEELPESCLEGVNRQSNLKLT